MAELTFDKDKLTGFLHGKRFERNNATERDVEIPPALIITDTDGAVWSFGNEYIVHNKEFEFNVLRNDVDMGETAKRIVYVGGVVTIYGSYGRKRFSRNRRHFI